MEKMSGDREAGGPAAEIFSPVPAVSFTQPGRFVPTLPGTGGEQEGFNPYVASNIEGAPRRSKAEKRRTSLPVFELLRDMSLKAAFALFVAAFILLALVISLLSTYAYNSYSTGANPDGAWFPIVTTLYFLSIPLVFIGCILVAGWLFYKTRLHPPIKILDDASGKISEEDLGFTVHYHRRDEMGRLCASFEQMRSVLETNNKELWRQMQERRRLYSAFSHDLRTPLTVLKGNLLILREFTFKGNETGERFYDIIQSMENHVARLENYVEVMSKLQKLEDIEVERLKVDSGDFIGTLRNTSEILAKDFTLSFFGEVGDAPFSLDPRIVIPVVENLMSNAVRFAKDRIAVVCSRHRGYFSVSVTDDGAGFTKSALDLVTNPFYKSEKNIFNAHFGLGLHISKILAERHGGKLTITNISAGGALVKADFLE